jgi:undecaprenyl-diphosphatase
MTYFESIILGILQGLTEFLPVSSSGHLAIGNTLFNLDTYSSFYFTIAVHGATVLSTIVVFRKEIWDLISGTLKFRMNSETNYMLKILLSMIPVGIVGVLCKDEVEHLFNGNIIFIGMMLLITAAILATAHFMRKKNREIGYKDALIIGIAQAIAVIPGISRSGSTIATGMMIGNKKDEVAKFSFLMVLIPVLGANILEIFSGEAGGTSVSFGVILTGFIAAFVSGYIACKWMISLVRKSKLIWFSVYCAVVGLITIFFL